MNGDLDNTVSGIYECSVHLAIGFVLIVVLFVRFGIEYSVHLANPAEMPGLRPGPLGIECSVHPATLFVLLLPLLRLPKPTHFLGFAIPAERLEEPGLVV